MLNKPNKIWLAPAKINRFLHITGQREDGYHELQTVFQFLDHCDELSFTIRSDNKILHQNPLAGVKPEDDLTVRAAKLLQHDASATQGVEISINKRLPMGGGLGGGSSDAATTLVALNELWQLNRSTDELAKLGVQLGADVPIFVHGYAAWAEGVGERLSEIELDEPWFVVVVPSVSVSTAAIFSHPDLPRHCALITQNEFLSGKGTNVCELIVREKYPQVEQAIQFLAQFSPARMTGTGACVFAALDSEQKAKKILGQIPAKMTGFIARGKNKSPLYS
ncbi:4-(cytidine 5'-diphospho)-2-C-methyl-D-erythritol kinase [sulfur-oxidizing endosymbiont of Gigantopelta aegis]|uniref:4-(cytidine 5'-diphospho)-2-C-methyl-D-erythritol kinase n=1 Tax=sulfur-oxidizing endosymbiont of Gigantopelta aegis TaxID=2794934 RepID=UPI0018DE068F|nr:4-(cytidine 5'-diphospho)-2-C-methyl-D-erythritol kinase [sulfur-oxidizing endosymbiont of Gigantopelta aegis]